MPGGGGPKILLVIGGGIAAYKSCELVRLIRRQGGTVTTRLTLASPDDAPGWGRGVYGFTSDQLCLGGITVVGSERSAGLTEGCVRGVLPAAGEAVDVEATMPDSSRIVRSDPDPVHDARSKSIRHSTGS